MSEPAYLRNTDVMYVVMWLRIVGSFNWLAFFEAPMFLSFYRPSRVCIARMNVLHSSTQSVNQSTKVPYVNHRLLSLLFHSLFGVACLKHWVPTVICWHAV